jgi:peptide deformylase
MTVREIRHHPDDMLRGKARKVSHIDESIHKLIDDMIETMEQANGVGLAAPQIGIPLRVAVFQLPEEEPIVLINPEIVKRSQEYQITEGCLSVPGLVGDIKRSASVTAKGLDRSGKVIKVRAEGLMAQAIQHELDHLNGTLFIDHVEDESKLHPAEETATTDDGESS